MDGCLAGLSYFSFDMLFSCCAKTFWIEKQIDWFS